MIAVKDPWAEHSDDDDDDDKKEKCYNILKITIIISENNVYFLFISTKSKTSYHTFDS